ncbi:MAG: O-antigen polymerase [Thermodesulfobacteriota bacterium]
MSNLIIHPLFIWSMIWGSAIFLNNRYYSNLLEPFGCTFYIVVSCIFIGSLYLVVFRTVAHAAILLPDQLIDRRPDYDISKLQKYLLNIFIILLFGYTIEIIICGWIPIVWYLGGIASDILNYHEFGIKGLHGLFQSLYFLATTGIFLCYLKKGNKKYLIYFVLALFISVIFITRQGIIVVLLQSAILYFLNRKVKISNIILTIGIIIANVMLFGLIGAFRTGTESFMALAQFTDKWPSWLPSGFAWVYIYITTPLSNLDNTFNTFIPRHTLYHSICDLLPTPIRVIIYSEEELVKGSLASTFNVSTYLVETFQDFGIVGPIFFGILAFALCYYVYLKAVNVKTIDYQLMYAILGQCLILSIFFNHFTFLPIMTQFVWIWIFRLYANKYSLTHMDTFDKSECILQIVGR